MNKQGKTYFRDKFNLQMANYAKKNLDKPVVNESSIQLNETLSHPTLTSNAME